MHLYWSPDTGSTIFDGMRDSPTSAWNIKERLYL